MITLDNSIPTNVKPSDRVKLKYSACRCLRTLLNSGDGRNNLNLFEFRDFTEEGTIYYEANDFNEKFINFLTEKSEIFLFFLQINSGSGINLLSNEFMSRISMLNEKNIKDNLLSTIPKYAIKIKSKSRFNACTFNEVKITCINEFLALGQDLDINTLRIECDDDDYNLRYLLSNLMQHEDFGHINFSINFYAFYDEKIERPSDIHYSKNLSPFKYYMVNAKKEMIQEIVKEIKIQKIYDVQEEEKKEINEKRKEDNKQEIQAKVNIDDNKEKKEDKGEINEDNEVNHEDKEEKKVDNERKNEENKQKKERENRKGEKEEKEEINEENNEKTEDTERKKEDKKENERKKEENNKQNKGENAKENKEDKKQKKEENNKDNKEKKEEFNKINNRDLEEKKEEIKEFKEKNNENNDEKKKMLFIKKRK